MVDVTYDWDSFVGYSEHCKVGSYSVKETVSGMEVSVMAGRMGYKGEFDPADPDMKATYISILKWCKLKGYVKIEYSVSAEVFHS